MGGKDTHLGDNPKLRERIERFAHQRQVRIAAHDYPDRWLCHSVLLVDENPEVVVVSRPSSDPISLSCSIG